MLRGGKEADGAATKQNALRPWVIRPKPTRYLTRGYPVPWEPRQSSEFIYLREFSENMFSAQLFAQVVEASPNQIQIHLAKQ